jgi:hypothetical protein
MAEYGQVIDAGPFGTWVANPAGGFLPFVQTEQFGGFVQTGQGQFVSYNPTPAAAAPSAPSAPAAGGTQTTQCEPPYVFDEETQSCMLPEDIQRRNEQRAEAERRAREEEQRRRGDEQARIANEQMVAAQRAARQESARDLITRRLEAYGLGNLGSFVWNLISTENITSEYALVERIRETDQYKQRFPAMAMRRQAGMNAISEEEYVSLEKGYRQVLKIAGMPANLFDTPEDFTNLIGGDVSVTELNQRVQQGYQAVAQSNPQVINEMKRLYGIDDAGLAAYFLAPERATPVLLRQARAAQIAAEGTLQAGMEITGAQAEQLAVAGISQEAARQGFQTIAGAEELFVPLPGTTEQAITQEEQIAGVFGTQAAAQQRVRQRARERAAAFQAGGRFAGQGTTVTGLQ